MRVCEVCGTCFDDGIDLCIADGGGVRDDVVGSLAGSRVLCGRYRIEKHLASGAMGHVYEAVHLAVGSAVAVKVMEPQEQALQVSMQRFHREARILGAVKHPHAVLITDFDIDYRPGQPLAFLVTELLRGRPLSVLLESQKTLNLDECERVLVPLCDAVAEAHALGIIHRDLKPANVFLERLRDGSEIVKVLDFGIAKLLTQRDATTATATTAPVPVDLPPLEETEQTLRHEILAALDDSMSDGMTSDSMSNGDSAPTVSGRLSKAPSASTYAGLMVGTVPYMAAEQMTGERITRRADVHALGVMVFEMLTGHWPFDGDDDDIIKAKLSGEIPTLREHGVTVDKELELVIKACLSPYPDDRPDSAHELSRAVQQAAARARGAVDDVVGTVSLRLSTTARALSRISDDVALMRDALLSANAALQKVKPLIDALPKHVAAPPQRALVQAHLEMDDAITAVRDVLGAIERSDAEKAAWLLSLWRRIDDVITKVGDAIEGNQAEPEAPAFVVFDDPAELHARPWAAVLAGLASKDSLDIAESLDEILRDRAEDVVRALQGGDDGAVLVDSLWRAAELVVLRDLGVERGALRYVPLLAAHPHDRGRFAGVISALRDRRGILIFDELTNQEEPTLRSLLLHPIAEVRQRAANSLPLASLWAIASHPRTPLPTHGVIFRQLKKRGVADHLKVFFFCVRDALLSCSVAELPEAVAIVRELFEVPAFHEDLLFEPLIDCERALRERAGAAGLLDESYARALAVFVRTGVHEEVPLEHLRDVPLALQRKLAREGHFLSTFVTHANDRIAQETVPHLLRLEDVTRYLRMTTIHRAVLTELAKRRRFFKKDAPKLALLSNPKTPAALARHYIGLVSNEQLRLLSQNRHMNPDVRRLIVQAIA